MNFKKLISAFTAFGIAAGMSALNVNAAADNGFTQAEISASEIKPYITLTKQVLPIYEAYYNNSVTVQVMVDTEDYSYATTGLHIYYDPRLEIETDYDGRLNVKKGEAAENLTFEASEDPTAGDYGMKGIFISTAGDHNGGKSGVLAEITFTLPYYADEGDIYPLDIVYKENDEFTTFNNDATGKLMQAWTFTHGIYNSKYNNNFYAPYSDIDRCWELNYIYGSYDGYIAIERIPVTTTTTMSMTTTTRTTISTTTTTTTAMPTITVPYTTTLSYTTTPRPTTTIPYTTTLSYTTTPRPTTTIPYTTTASYTTTVSPTITMPYTTTLSYTTTPRTTTTVSHTTTPKTTTTTTTKPSGISIIPDKITMNAGDTNRLALIGAANSEDIIWTSGNTSVASVDENGKVTAKKAGKAEIFAVYNNQSASCIVTVVSGDVTGITLIGDANGDNELSVADATLILQYCGNKDKYKISEQGLLNADVDGTPGISPLDALIIQQVDAGIYDISDLPLTK